MLCASDSMPYVGIMKTESRSCLTGCIDFEPGNKRISSFAGTRKDSFETCFVGLRMYLSIYR